MPIFKSTPFVMGNRNEEYPATGVVAILKRANGDEVPIAPGHDATGEVASEAEQVRQQEVSRHATPSNIISRPGVSGTEVPPAHWQS